MYIADQETHRLMRWLKGAKEGEVIVGGSGEGSQNNQLVETWKAMKGLVDEGLVKSIGLSNFNEEQIERILRICKIKPVVNQVEIHPYCPQIELEEFCRKHHILLEAYAPLGSIISR